VATNCAAPAASAGWPASDDGVGALVVVGALVEVADPDSSDPEQAAEVSTIEQATTMTVAADRSRVGGRSGRGTLGPYPNRAAARSRCIQPPRATLSAPRTGRATDTDSATGR